ncbi:MAG: metallophosphoesterase [Sphingobacteriales bacterium]|nr:metallophosphoesterase [Sphingobacteriales bacterium]
MVYFHHPPYTKEQPQLGYRSGIDRDANYTPIFDQYKVDLVLCGHTPHLRSARFAKRALWR